MRFYRTMLFAPGSNMKVVVKALASNADAVIVDLEDAVAPNSKESARCQIVDFLSADQETNSDIYIRINGWDSDWGKKDFESVTKLPISGIILPKTNSSGELSDVVSLLPPNMDIIPLIETATGVLNSREIAMVKGISRLAFGAVDFTTDIGTSLSKTGIELLYARSLLVLASKAAGIYPPIDTVFPDIKDTTGYLQELTLVKQLGMLGKLVIHPSQIALAHQVFSPTAEEIEYAEKVIAAYAEAENSGVGAIQFEGKMIDYPVASSAKKLLELSKRI